MRIAYIGPYQGPGLLERRPIVINLSLAGNLKIELIAALLHERGHHVDILSQGEVVERGLTFYPAFSESIPGHDDIRAHYASTWPLRFVNAVWPILQLLRLLRKRHAAAPYDLVLAYNLKGPQLACALHAMRHLGVPVVLEYEDDALVDVTGTSEPGLITRWYRRLADSVLSSVSGCTGVSPHLLSRLPASTPKLLLRGVVSSDVLDVTKDTSIVRNNWVVYSGTHSRAKGLEPLVNAWRTLDLPGWELHIGGHGELTPMLKELAASRPDIIFHGLRSPLENARFLAGAKIAVNPHDVSQTPGNVFAFKIIEYLAAGAHVVTTPMGALEPELETGITYMPDNSPATVAATLSEVIHSGRYRQNATQAAQERYGPAAIAESLDALLRQASNVRPGDRQPAKVAHESAA